MSRRPRRHLRQLAVLALVAWVAGVEILPSLHLASHGEVTPHHHAGDRVAAAPKPAKAVRGVRVVAGRSTHAHHRRALGLASGRADSPAPSHSHQHDPPGAPAGGHGRHSLEHRAVAWLAPPVVLIQHPVVVVVPAPAFVEPTAPQAVAPTRAAASRAPPRLAA